MSTASTRALLVGGALLGGALLGAAAAPASARPARDEARAARAVAADSQVVGVLPFAADARDTLLGPLAFGLADILATDLSRSQRLTLVERARLGAVLRELSLASEGAVDSATAPRAGRLIQARTLVTGSLQRRGLRDVVFTARLTDVGTGRVETALVASAPLNDVLAAEKEIVFRLFNQLRVQLTPQERALVEQRPTRNLAALVAYGQGVQAEVNAQYAAAVVAYRRASGGDPGFRQALQRAGAARRLGSPSGSSVAERVNRGLETVPTTPRPGLPTDPAFPGARASLTVIFTRP